MRPRLITAENVEGRQRFGRRGSGFNEAAAHHRGEPLLSGQRSTTAAAASMRPRLITAENAVIASNIARAQAGFNEAAAHHRGEHHPPPAPAPKPIRFNEAAAHHRGELRQLHAFLPDHQRLQ